MYITVGQGPCVMPDRLLFENSGQEFRTSNSSSVNHIRHANQPVIVHSLLNNSTGFPVIDD